MPRTRKPDPQGRGSWTAAASGRELPTLVPLATPRGPVLRIDYRLGAGAFVVARRTWRRPVPAEFRVHVRLRARGAPGALELKLVDRDGAVWRHSWPAPRLGARWRELVVPGAEFEPAWGPASGSRPAGLEAVEFALLAGGGSGGPGSLWIADLRFEAVPPFSARTAQASSARRGHGARQALTTGWQPRADDPRPWLEIDSGTARDLGGLGIEWLAGAPRSGFRLRGSASGRRWTTLYQTGIAAGPRSELYLPGARVRRLRLELDEPSGGATLRPRPAGEARSLEVFCQAAAGREPRGWHPRWLLREQSDWTLIGAPAGGPCALLNEDGAIEAGAGSWSIEPMLVRDGRLLTWADVRAELSLEDGWKPCPAVRWTLDGLSLRIDTAADASGALRLRYRLDNHGAAPLHLRLFLLLRPFQVTPPWQRFGRYGGIAAVHALEWRDGLLMVNDAPALRPVEAPDFRAALSFDEGAPARWLAAGELPPRTRASDRLGLGSALLGYQVTLAPGATREFALDSLLRGPTAARPPGGWDGVLDPGRWQGERCADAVRAMCSATAQILASRDGPALQPGARRYTRSWIRDGSLMAAALLRMGRAAEARDYLRWYLPRQRADGFVPCCVDGNGPDWTVEHDSHGQLLALIADCQRFAPDPAFAAGCWPAAERAAACIERLLDETGLLPVSISHEGYAAQPVHAYWDDFWALRGLRDAVWLATELDHGAAAQRWQTVATRLEMNLLASIERTRAAQQLATLPASREWADFDPTATANAVMLFGPLPGLDRMALERTFDDYLAGWRSKRRGERAWTNYSPYEIRIIGALVRLGRRDDAQELLRFFLAERRPPAWNQWPEIAWRAPRAPGHLGDLPHAWVGAEYVLALRACFVYERLDERRLVLAAGVAADWLDGDGVRIVQAPTAWGPLGYRLRRLDARRLRFELDTGPPVPLLLEPPLARPIAAVEIDGSAHAGFDDRSVRLEAGAATVIITTN